MSGLETCQLKIRVALAELNKQDFEERGGKCHIKNTQSIMIVVTTGGKSGIFYIEQGLALSAGISRKGGIFRFHFP